MKLVWDSQRTAQKAEGRYIRERSDNLYHTFRWTRLSASWRAQHPLCEECKRQGKITPAQVVDHITPWPICGEAGFYDAANLQSLCEACNHAKGQRDKAAIAAWRREHAPSRG